MEINRLYKLFHECNGVSIDSRSLEEGALFFGLKGQNFDGNKYAISAIEKGAKYAVIDDPVYHHSSEKMVLVEDSLKSLQGLAAYHRQQFNIPIIGLTGSNGKTTTKELLQTVLSTTFKTHSTKGNFNNHIGVPLTLLAMPMDTEIAVIEMGANHIGEILALCLISQPTHGFITNVGKAHLEGFGSFEGVKRAKSELYHFLANSSGKIFINTSEIDLVGLLPEYKEIYSYSNTLTFKGILSSISSYPLLDFLYHLENDGKVEIQSKLFGTYNIPNISTAIALAEYFNVSANDIADGINSYQPKNKRSELMVIGDYQIIMDAYNANPVSMKFSIKDFSEWGNEDKVLILGDMLELGEFATQEHVEMLAFIQKKSWKKIYVVGQEFNKAASGGNNVLAFNSTEELIEHLNSSPIAPAKILIKGSRILKLERVLEQIRKTVSS